MGGKLIHRSSCRQARAANSSSSSPWLVFKIYLIGDMMSEAPPPPPRKPLRTCALHHWLILRFDGKKKARRWSTNTRVFRGLLPQVSIDPWLSKASPQHRSPPACTSGRPAQTACGRRGHWEAAPGSASGTREPPVPPWLSRQRWEVGRLGRSSAEVWDILEKPAHQAGLVEWSINQGPAEGASVAPKWGPGREKSRMNKPFSEEQFFQRW